MLSDNVYFLVKNIIHSNYSALLPSVLHKHLVLEDTYNKICLCSHAANLMSCFVSRYHQSYPRGSWVMLDTYMCAPESNPLIQLHYWKSLICYNGIFVTQYIKNLFSNWILLLLKVPYLTSVLPCLIHNVFVVFALGEKKNKPAIIVCVMLISTFFFLLQLFVLVVVFQCGLSQQTLLIRGWFENWIAAPNVKVGFHN